MLYRVCWLGLAISGWILITIIIQEIIYAKRAPRAKLKYIRTVSYHGPCRECRGDGVCRWCYGKGHVKGFFGGEKVCPYCGGTGICPRCGGKYITGEEHLQHP